MATMLSDRDLLARLVAFDSTSSNSNLPIADFICDYLESFAPSQGLQFHRNPNPDGTKANIVVRLPGFREVPNPARPGLILSGHLDTVPATENEWESDPFTLRNTGTAYVGRGACDMKGFVALAVNAFARACEWRLEHPLVLLLTFDEEPGILGAKYFVETWRNAIELPRSAVVGEPTELDVVRMHKGHLKLRVTVNGTSAHSGYPHLGVNAIEPFGSIIRELAGLRGRLESVREPSSEFYPETPFPSLSLTQIHGGVASNVIPDRCELILGIRVLPGMAEKPLIDAVHEAVIRGAGSSKFSIESVNDSPALLTSEDAPLYRAVCELVGQRRTHAVSYATDGGPLQQLGLQCVIWGPGNIEVAHKPNEWIGKEDLQRGGELLEQLVRSWCKAGV